MIIEFYFLLFLSLILLAFSVRLGLSLYQS